MIPFGDSSFGKSKNDCNTIKNHWELMCMEDTEDKEDIMEKTENWERVGGGSAL